MENKQGKATVLAVLEFPWIWATDAGRGEALTLHAANQKLERRFLHAGLPLRITRECRTAAENFWTAEGTTPPASTFGQEPVRISERQTRQSEVEQIKRPQTCAKKGGPRNARKYSTLLTGRQGTEGGENQADIKAYTTSLHTSPRRFPEELNRDQSVLQPDSAQ